MEETGLVHFAWHRSTAGVVCAEGLHSSDLSEPERRTRAWYLIERDGPPPVWEATYPLRDNTGLFLEFAQLEPSEAAIVAFASQFGLLTYRHHAISLCSQPPHPVIRWQDDPDVLGEPFDLWVEEITRMRQMVRLWTWLRVRDVKGISTVIVWSRDGSEVWARWPGEWPANSRLFGKPLFNGRRGCKLASKDYREDYFAQMPRGDVFLPAWMELLDGINEKLTKHVARPQLIFDHGKPLLRIVPDSLISALWFQFANAADQDRVYQRCQGCGKLFAEGVAAKGARRFAARHAEPRSTGPESSRPKN